MGVGIQDNNAVGGARVNTEGELTVATTQTAIDSGFVSLVAEKGVLPNGTRKMHELECSEDYRLRVEQDAVLFSDYPVGTALNTSILTTRVTASQTVVVGSNRYELNSSGLATVNSGSMIRTNRTFPWYKANTLYAEIAVAWSLDPVANWYGEWGFSNATTAIAAPTDGVFFRITAGEFRGILLNASVETQIDLGTIPDSGDVHDCVIEMTQGVVNFWVDNVLRGSKEVPVTQFGPQGVLQNYLLARTYNGAVIPAVAIKLQISAWQVSIGGADLNRLYPTMRSGMGGGSYQVPSGAAAGQTANWTNSAAVVAIAAGSLANTAASFTGLGGQFHIGCPAAADTDFNILKYLVPAGNTLFVSGVRIDAANIGAAVATTATTVLWGVAIGSSADTLAGTEDAVGVKARRMIPLGMQSWPVAAAIGTLGPTIGVNFDAPLCIHGGEYISFAVKFIVGTATASQALRGAIMVNGFFE